MGNFNMLPRDIVFDILTRLPAESAVECKLVSKSWNNLISHQSFSVSHLNLCLNNLDSAGGSGGKFTFLFLNENPISRYRLFHFLEFYDKNFSSEEQPFHRVTRMRLNPAPFKDYNFAGTCNGLVCLNGFYEYQCHWFMFNYEPVYICNPITRECVLLPRFQSAFVPGERFVTGFGYASSTKEYKVVRMYNVAKDPISVRVEVYTLGSGKGWRNLGKKLNKDLDLFIPIHGELLNESLYWELKDGTIVAFDLDSEIFRELPQFFPTSWNFRLGVLGGYLSAAHHDKDSNTFEIWLLKEKKEDGSLNSV